MQMVDNNYGSLSSSYSYLASYKACYERAGYRASCEAGFFFVESDLFVALPRGSNTKCATVCCRRLQLNSGKLYTALGFDINKFSAFNLEGCRFRRVGSAHASRCTPLASPKR